jgi:hypothetical protein
LKKCHHIIHSTPPIIFPGLHLSQGWFDVLQIFFDVVQSVQEFCMLNVSAMKRGMAVGERRGGRGT